ncbi:MAG: hypothetical protein F2954_00980 [Actinobacteria bacterium]|uniref:Unannotated protein n=1 Tax=freshwater metagenome TaxID=449393 RepID=A0A6J7VQC1_9ZZZZ|nr:hypothetical protein [Actinomycetota bacterium]
MAVKKKSAAKKVAKKAPAKRVVKKTAKKSVAKKSVVKKKVAKKAPAKRVAKKAVAKKAPAKRVAKRVAKKAVAKKAPAKRAVKKSTAKPVTQLVSVSTTPMPPKPTPAEIKPVAVKPVAAPKQSTSGRVVFLVVAGIVILAAIVWSKSGSDSDDSATPTPSISQSAEPTESATAEPTESATAEPTESAAPVVAVEAPSKFVALKNSDGLKLRWVAPSAVDGLTGYNVDVRANGAGDWMTIATVPADQLTQNVTKSSDTGWTQFRVSSVYSDGQVASATVFGIPGEFK